MSTNKILIGGIVGGVAFFFLGWLIYGILLAGYMQSHTNQSLMKPMEDMIWWALIVANIGWGFLLTLILGWADARSAVSGAKIGAIVGLLASISLDLSFYSMYTLFADFSPIIVDVLASTLMWTIAGAIIGWILRKA